VKKTTLIFFGLLVGVFVLWLSSLFISAVREIFKGTSFILLLVSIFIFGFLLLIFTLKLQPRGLLKKFLVLISASSLGMVGGGILHNLLYALCIYFFGANFWEKIGLGDEPVFFFIAVIISPLAFLVGLIGTLVILIKNRLKK
jgi:hypothetical protein